MRERLSTRATTRLFGVAYNTLAGWLGEKTDEAPTLEDTLLPAEAGDVLELDENWGFMGAKCNQVWLWVALCRRTRQIVSYTLGDRSQESACFLYESLPTDYRRRATRSDFWDAYGVAFPARTHRFCAKHEGETNHVERFFGTLRARFSRLVRRSYAFSKSVERHAQAIHLFITSYNLEILRQHTL